jgi:hypothetical protein
MPLFVRILHPVIDATAKALRLNPELEDIFKPLVIQSLPINKTGASESA